MPLAIPKPKKKKEKKRKEKKETSMRKLSLNIYVENVPVVPGLFSIMKSAIKFLSCLGNFVVDDIP